MEIIEFIDKRYARKRTRGWKVGDQLAVTRAGKNYKIFNTSTGKPIIDVSFKSVDDAVEIAKWLEITFGEFFCILDTYPEVDIFSLAKWSVKDGVQAYLTIDRMKGKYLTKEEVRKLFLEEKQNVSEWTRD